tara:strand:+ start:1363 stop:2535 length:1173 start_codon:yes stop_codon:yes gene_type:complete
MTSSVLVVLLLSLAINAVVGGYFRILAKNQYEPVAFNFWAASCSVYCLGLLGSALATSIPSISALSTFSGLLYLTASYLLLHGFLSFNIQCVLSTVKHTANRVFVFAILLILGVSWNHELVEVVTSLFIALMFLFSFQSFQSQQWKTIKGISVLLRGILFIHFIIMMARAGLTAGATYYGLASNLQVLITITVGLHVLLCVATSALLPFIILSKEKGEWEAMANFDELTGVFGRRAFIRKVLNRLKSKSRRPFTLLVIDIDFFKAINDNYGHPEGDKVLKSVAQCLQEQLREGDIVGRLGGEEFGVIISHQQTHHAYAIADRLRESVASLSIYCGSQPIKVTISIGMSSSNNVEDTWNTLFNRADTELYKAKKTGRNKVSPEIMAEATLV